MKTIGMTQEEFDFVEYVRLKTHYSDDEIAGIMNLLKKYVNRNVVYCPGCQGTFALNKTEFFTWFNNNKEQIKEELKPTIKAVNSKDYLTSGTTEEIIIKKKK